jgi:catechol 2,3-dioxygenase-like lactoylglutathione lyase family enzyme
MLDHVTIKVSDLERSRAFYDAALSPLNISRVYDGEANFSGYGSPDKAYFWIGAHAAQPISGMHIAFVAENRVAVDAFHAKALAAGRRDNGAPGLRPHYHENYYGASCMIRTATTSKPSATVRQADRSNIALIVAGALVIESPAHLMRGSGRPRPPAGAPRRRLGAMSGRSPGQSPGMTSRVPLAARVRSSRVSSSR